MTSLHELKSQYTLNAGHTSPHKCCIFFFFSYLVELQIWHVYVWQAQTLDTKQAWVKRLREVIQETYFNAALPLLNFSKSSNKLNASIKSNRSSRSVYTHVNITPEKMFWVWFLTRNACPLKQRHGGFHVVGRRQRRASGARVGRFIRLQHYHGQRKGQLYPLPNILFLLITHQWLFMHGYVEFLWSGISLIPGFSISGCPQACRFSVGERIYLKSGAQKGTYKLISLFNKSHLGSVTWNP